MVMAFNPDEPHDGHAATELGFTYRIVHIGPELVTEVLGDAAGRSAGAPLFVHPVVHDPVLAEALRALHATLVGRGGRLARDERLAAAVGALVRRAALRRAGAWQPRPVDDPVIARRVCELLHDRFAEDVTSDDLAAAAGCSRYAVYRARFRGSAVTTAPPSTAVPSTSDAATPTTASPEPSSESTPPPPSSTITGRSAGTSR
ncbi:hypothetical protein GTS_01050 [Gandjariella thermophila]|uniref:AraC-type arabinose-binding/dimerisation domain-containing protein n=1 Tax=Gandjariella thermophila TaxID=1931992 RepID=A0A4D4J076_9PSEU|nr:hypothetical protein GTS_01050 [Gandjariella thermophila]